MAGPYPANPMVIASPLVIAGPLVMAGPYPAIAIGLRYSAYP
jgi:hypothetical protein